MSGLLEQLAELVATIGIMRALLPIARGMPNPIIRAVWPWLGGGLGAIYLVPLGVAHPLEAIAAILLGAGAAVERRRRRRARMRLWDVVRDARWIVATFADHDQAVAMARFCDDGVHWYTVQPRGAA